MPTTQSITPRSILHSIEILLFHLRQNDLHPKKFGCIVEEPIIYQRFSVSGIFILF